MVTYFVLGLHLFLCFVLVMLVLVQQGKGADMGAAFGAGGSASLFGAGGAPDFIVKVTTSVAFAFFVTSVILVRAYDEINLSSTPGVADPLSGSLMQGQTAPAVSQGEQAVEPAPAANAPMAKDAAAAPAPIVPPAGDSAAEALGSTSGDVEMEPKAGVDTDGSGEVLPPAPANEGKN